jgi:hypothetical protein
MALHTDTDIYKPAYDLLGKSIDVVKNMPRDFKSVVGPVIMEHCLTILTLIRRTNQADRGAARLPHLDELLERVEQTETLFRVSVERGQVERGHISRGQYADLVKLTQSLSRQAGGWRKSSKATSPDVRGSRPPEQRDLQPGRAAGP